MSRAAAEIPTVMDHMTEVRITDPYTVRLIAEEQARTGEKSAARVASRLIAERMAIREVNGEPAPAGVCDA